MVGSWFKKSICSALIFCFAGCIFVASALAAMDPVEVEKQNNAATYQVIGEITSDELFQDITTDEKHPKQLRKMEINISKVLKAPEGLEENDSVDVFYHYIPLWDARSYVGGKRMDIAKGDIVTIWLSKGEYGWEPALGGYSVEHMQYSTDRSEPIPEPFWHAVVRKFSELRDIQPDIFVLCGLVVVLVWAVFRGLRKTT